MSLLSPDQLRQQIRVRLAHSRLAIVGGVYKRHRGAGQPCIVCRRAVELADVQCDVTESGRAVLMAHEACYMLWREESVSYRVDSSLAKQTSGAW
jgi:hypothetical protein